MSTQSCSPKSVLSFLTGFFFKLEFFSQQMRKLFTVKTCGPTDEDNKIEQDKLFTIVVAKVVKRWLPATSLHTIRQ